MIFNQLILGLLLGLAAAIPIGPINIEMIRRNLHFGMRYGLNFGLGACGADVTYFILLLSGTLVLLRQHVFLRIVGVGGSLVLAWFGVAATRMRLETPRHHTTSIDSSKIIWRQFLQGYLLTLLNPLTIIFWASLSTQVAVIATHGTYAAIVVSIGVLVGTVSWIVALNTVLHLTRHRLSAKAMRYFNYIGGLIILGFAWIGLWRALH